MLCIELQIFGKSEQNWTIFVFTTALVSRKIVGGLIWFFAIFGPFSNNWAVSASSDFTTEYITI